MKHCTVYIEVRWFSLKKTPGTVIWITWWIFAFSSLTSLVQFKTDEAHLIPIKLAGCLRVSYLLAENIEWSSKFTYKKKKHHITCNDSKFLFPFHSRTLLCLYNFILFVLIRIKVLGKNQNDIVIDQWNITVNL